MFNNTLYLLILLLPYAVAENCRDNAGFSWQNHFKGETFDLNCEFLTASKIEERNIRRQSAWCNRRVNGSLVKNKCKATCNQCGSCSDTSSNWVDSIGNGCSWYEKGDINRCAKFGDRRRNNGLVANKVCCECGGGSRGDGNDSGNRCTNVYGWHEEGFPDYNCQWYAGNPKIRCKNFGGLNQYLGKTASQACCVCKKI